jgi:Skp family chaperone for outer membrane proteins
MKLPSTLPAAASRALLACVATFLAGGVASAQGGTVAPSATQPAASSASATPQPATAQRPTGPLPAGRVAIINTSVFAENVQEMKKVIGQLNARFDPQTKELLALRDRLTSLENQAKQGAASPQQTEQMTQQYKQLKTEFDRKNEDLQVAGRQAYAQVTDPVRKKMGDALQKFAAARGIVLVIEIGAAFEKASIFYVSQAADITAAFVDEYNKANPAP